MTSNCAVKNWRPGLISALAAALVFQGEFLAGKRLLPEFGGSAYVWCSAILFFQIVLIAGYYGSRWLGELPEKKRTLTLTLLGLTGLLALPSQLWVFDKLPLELQPVIALLPFAGLSLALFCTTPLLHQRQIDRTNYNIYAWSNAGALVGLITYPLLVEPLVDLKIQSLVWALGGLAICSLGLRENISCRRRREETLTSSDPTLAMLEPPHVVSYKTRLSWWILPAISSAALLATTNEVTYEANAGPLAWALPLVLFLGTYIWAFSGNRRSSVGLIAVCGLAALVVSRMMPMADARSLKLLSLLLLSGGATMLCCHVWLAATRNENTHGFYRAIAISGAIGSALMVLVIPHITTGPVEFPILTIATLTVAGFKMSGRWVRPLLTMTAVVAIGANLAAEISGRDKEVARARTLYGCLRVIKDSEREYYSLVHNTTIHGEEDRNNPNLATEYYGQSAGLGLAMRELQSRSPSIKVAVIGLGVGSINRYLRPTDTITYFELDPKIEDMARQYFTFLQNHMSPVIIGDGRKSLERSRLKDLDLLILDAFNGDAIPMHLLTREAGIMYRQHMKTNGLIALHITNAHADLEPVCRGLAQNLGMGVEFSHTTAPPISHEEEQNIARRIAQSLGMNAAMFRYKATDWAILHPNGQPRTGRVVQWTDQRSSIVGVLK